VDREIGLTVRSEPVVGEVEVIKRLRRRRRRALEREVDRGVSMMREVDGARDRGNDDAERNKKCQAFAPSSPLRARE
jgi:hypothetical protein